MGDDAMKPRRVRSRSTSGTWRTSTMMASWQPEVNSATDHEEEKHVGVISYLYVAGQCQWLDKPMTEKTVKK